MATNEIQGERPAGRLVIDSLEEPSVIPMLGWSEVDTFFGLGALSIGGIIGVAFGLQWYFVLMLGLLTGGIGMALVNAAPPYANVIEFFKTIKFYARHHNEVKNQAEAAIETNDSLIAQFQTPETTRERTNIKRFIPKYGLIERTTGEFQVMMKYYPANQDFVEPQELIDLINAIEQWAITDGNFDWDWWVTTKSVETEEYIVNLQAKRYDTSDDRTVIEQELLRSMATEEAETIRLSSEVPEYYFLLDVTIKEASDDYVGDKSTLQRAAETPVIGTLFKGFVDSQEELTEEEKYDQMLSVIQRRVNKMSRLAENLSGARMETVPIEDYIKLQFEYWNGYSTDLTTPRQSPIVKPEEPQGEA